MELLTVREVSKKLKMNANDTYKLINKGYIKYLKLGSIKIPDFELDRFMHESIGKDFSDLDNVTDIKEM